MGLLFDDNSVIVEERKPRLTQLLGEGVGLWVLCLVRIVELSGSLVQKALLQPEPILRDARQSETGMRREEKRTGTKQFGLAFQVSTKTFLAFDPYLYIFILEKKVVFISHIFFGSIHSS